MLAKSTVCIAIGTLVAFTSISSATTVSVTNAFLQLNNVSPNTLNDLSGHYLRFGGNAVPNGNSGTTAVGVTTNLLTGQTVTRSITFAGNTATPNMFNRYVVDDPNLHGGWQLRFTNGSDTTVRNLSFAPGATQIPFASSVTVSGSSLNPTFSWAAPAATTINGYRVNIYDKNRTNAAGNEDLVYTLNLQPNTTNFTIPDQLAGGLSLTQGHQYTLEILSMQTRDGLSTNLTNSNIASASRIYSDFSPLPNGSPAVNLPVTLDNGSYQFNLAVQAAQTYYLDPQIAIGYLFQIGSGDPNFASVTLPTLQSDPFTLHYLFGGNTFDISLLGGIEYFFPLGGVDAFRC